jgi:predicted RNA-binding Zn-ribbon protein involved in translation (DUF1610 family)
LRDATFLRRFGSRNASSRAPKEAMLFRVPVTAPQVSVVLASLVLWFSIAWGLPAEPTAEGGAEAHAEYRWGRWAGVKISDAYRCAKCPKCGKENELRAASCSRCGYEFPQPSAEFTYPPWVFVPGKGYYREGTLLEPAKSRKGLWITGLVIMGSGFLTLGVAADATEGSESPGGYIVAYITAPIAIGVGAVLLIVGLSSQTGPVYAFKTAELFGPYGRPAFALRSAVSEGAAFKVEVTALSF